LGRSESSGWRSAETETAVHDRRASGRAQAGLQARHTCAAPSSRSFTPHLYAPTRGVRANPTAATRFVILGIGPTGSARDRVRLLLLPRLLRAEGGRARDAHDSTAIGGNGCRPTTTRDRLFPAPINVRGRDGGDQTETVRRGGDVSCLVSSAAPDAVNLALRAGAGVRILGTSPDSNRSGRGSQAFIGPALES